MLYEVITLIVITVKLQKVIHYISCCPWVLPHLKKQLIHRQIESIDHAIFPFIYDPHRFPIAFEQLRAPVVRANAVSDVEPLRIIQPGTIPQAIEFMRGRLVGFKMFESITQHA